MFRQFVAPIESVVESATLPRSLRSVADVRAARTKEKIGHSGRDDRKKELRGASEIARAPKVVVAGGSCAHSADRVRDGDDYSGEEVQRMPNETVGL